MNKPELKIIIISCLISLLILGCKEKDEEKDINPPEIILKGDLVQTINCDSSVYEDPGYTANDKEDGDITSLVKRTGEVSTKVAYKTYYLKYNVSDKAGNAAEEKKRTVIVKPLKK